MSAIGPVAKAAKLAVKYGPQAKLVYDAVGDQAKEAARRQLAARRARVAAVAKAGTITDGSVLKVVHEGEPAWIVYAGDEPVEAYPATDVPLDTLVTHADLDQRRTPEEIREAQVRRRASRAVEGARARVRRRRPNEPGAPAEIGTGR